jgi:hypothetical protein
MCWCLKKGKEKVVAVKNWCSCCCCCEKEEGEAATV